jgi:O-antigen/teichoic acid export membrane protein
MGLNIFFVLKLKIGVLGILLGDLISLVFLLFLTLPYVLKFIKREFDKNLLKSMIIYGMPLLPLLLFMMLLDFSDRYIINIFWGSALAGIYSLGYQFGTIIQLFIYGFRFAWAPFFFKNPDETKIFSRVSLLFLKIGLIIWCGVSYFIPEIFKFFVNKNYHDATKVVPIVGLGYVFYGLQQIFTTPFFIYSKTINITIISSIGFLSNLILNLIFIPKYGMIAAASTTLFSFFITSIISLFWAGKIQNIPYKLKNIGFDISLSVFLFILIKNMNIFFRIIGFIFVCLIFLLESYYEKRNDK